MKKIFALLMLFIVVHALCNSVKAQGCAPCPAFFFVRDTIGCNSADITKNSSGIGPYTNGTSLINACKNSKMKYTLQTDGGCYPVVNYTLISISGGTLVNFTGNQFTVQWGASNNGNVVIVFNIPAGAGSAPCRDTISLNYNLINKPAAAFTASPQPACFNNPTVINFNSSGSVNAISYYWDFGDGFSSVLANPSHAYPAPGTYTVTLIVSNSISVNGSPVCPSCIDSVRHTVVINNLPGPDITCVASVCAGATETYCTGAAGCSSYTWSVTGGSIVSGQNTPCVTILWGSGNPQGSLSLVVAGCAGSYCPQGTTVNIPIIPVTGTITGPSPVCTGTSAVYTLPSWPGTTYSWLLSGGGAMTPYNTNTNQVNINWFAPGTYTITCNYFDTALNCGGAAVKTVTVVPPLLIAGTSAACAGATTSLNAYRNPGAVAVAANWTITPAGASVVSGNGTPSVNINWASPGIYTVTAIPVLLNVVCGSTTYTVTVSAAPVLTGIAGADSVCANQTYVYVPFSNMPALFTWNVTNGSAVLLGSNNDSAQITWGPAGPYSISVYGSSIPNNCVSNTITKNVFPYPVPAVTGPVSVCADNTETYTITNIASGNFVWSVYPPSFGTIISGQGTASVQIKWHGNNSPGNSNLVYLHFGVCSADSVAVTINEPPVVNITAAGTLCTGGITLSTGVTGTFTWTCTEHAIVPAPGNTSSISGINLPGHYHVTIQNVNGSGCTVTADYFIPDTGFPNAHISADNVLNYCLPNVPNMNLVADNSPGYTFQWFLNNVPAGTGPTLPVNTLTLPGAYAFYCVVTLGGCTDTSNVIVINISNCPPVTGCVAAIAVTSITGCNPFTLTLAATAPSGATLIGNPTILHYEDGTTVNSYTTHTYDTIGYKQIRICADVLLPDNSVCRVCKDTVVNVTAAANFSGNISCGKVTLTGSSAVVSPAVISSYTWLVGLNPGNTPVPPVMANFAANNVPNTVLNVNQSGSYIVTLIIKVGSCNLMHSDTFDVSVPDADFNVVNSCAGTPVALNNIVAAPVNFWDFGDAATSYTSPATHAYGSAGTYTITHIVTDVNGCKDTVTKNISIAAAPVCNIAYAGPTSFCFGDSLFLNACGGLTNIQWYNNGVAIPGAVTGVDTVTQTGNYSFIATNVSGCRVVSDTVSVTVTQAPNAVIIQSGSVCAGSTYTAMVPSCLGCGYQWKVDGNPVAFTNQISGTAGFGIFSPGVHTIRAIVTNASGCKDSSTVTVTFYALPSVGITVAPNPPQLCSNNLYVMTAVTNAASPAYAWTYNNTNIVLSATASYTASATGTYTVAVTDGITGCTAKANRVIIPSPELNLFPTGCDTLCDTSHLFLPLPSFNGNLTGYTIKWFDNAPPYSPVIATGPSFPLGLLSPGNHSISVIVTAPNGCVDTSNVYSVRTFNCLSVVAVRDLVLRVKQAGSYAVLNWTTNQETDNDHFIAERSIDGINFSYAGKVMSKGNSDHPQQYTLNDPIAVYNKTIYYRVRAVDLRGEYRFSSVVKLNPVKGNEETMMAQPNITAGNTEVIIQSNSALKTNIIIYAAEGREVKRMAVLLNKGITTIPVNVSSLPAGMYLLTAVTGERQLTVKIVRQ